MVYRRLLLRLVLVAGYSILLTGLLGWAATGGSWDLSVAIVDGVLYLYGLPSPMV